uniref:FAD/NAD(P)-binding domain-containing protein n=1 Tax=Glossina brevipalpis TaxID=37001 RepID=A0A1A9WZJ7_9MUSC
MKLVGFPSSMSLSSTFSLRTFMSRRFKNIYAFSGCLSLSSYIFGITRLKCIVSATISGGASAQMCAETLRKEVLTGRILMICKGPHFPYDRTALTRVIELSISQIEFCSKVFYAKYNIEVLLNTEVIKANMDEKSITTSYDFRLNYDKMFIATGGRARKLYIKGADLKNVFTMRGYDDLVRIREALKDKNVVCVGSLISSNCTSRLPGIFVFEIV